MAFTQPQYSRNDVNRAGHILADESPSEEDLEFATAVLANWRASHLYPINTFQATLRRRSQSFDEDAIVAQRLKRAPSVVAKLRRFRTMNLAQMQDIGGLRAVFGSLASVRKIEALYRDPKHLKHLLVTCKDYIATPKPDGYRSVRLVFKNVNENRPEYNGLHVELQFRTKVQHAWATAVETMSTFLGQALKFGQGDRDWREFFSVTSSALAHGERTTPVPGYEDLTDRQTFTAVAKAEAELGVLTKLQGFAIAASRISTDPLKGRYHLVVLDTASRSVRITAYSENRLPEANAEYAKVEERTLKGEQVEAVLVSAGPIDALRKAYPNYFLDTHAFVRHIRAVIEKAEMPTRSRPRSRDRRRKR